MTVRKTRHGVRPVAELFLRDQLLYRALVLAWDDQLPTPARSNAAYEAFEQGPLAYPWNAYIVSSDISAFYQYIDYELLARELLARTVTRTGWTPWSRFSAASLASASAFRNNRSRPTFSPRPYIYVLERTPYPAGTRSVAVQRRFPYSSRKLGGCPCHGRQLGTRGQSARAHTERRQDCYSKRDTYEETVRSRDQVLQRIAADAELDLANASFSLYGDPMASIPDPQDVQIAAAVRILERWRSTNAVGTGEHALLQLVPLLALSLLGGLPAEDDVLAICGELLATEQSLTPAVATFLTRVPTDNESADLARDGQPPRCEPVSHALASLLASAGARTAARPNRRARWGRLEGRG